MNDLYEIKRLLEEIQEEMPEGLPRRLRALEEKVRIRKWASMDGLELEKEKFSFIRALPYIVNRVPLDHWKNAGLEAEVFRQTAQSRTMSTTDDAAGGYLVPAQAMPEFIEMLRAESVVIRMGARVLPDLVGAPVTFVKQTGGATAYWVGEGTAPTASDLATGQVKMTPKKIMALTYVNNELIRRANPGAEILIRQDFVQQLALGIDYAALRGIGSENQPLGIANTPGINSVILGSGSGALPDWVHPWPDMEYELSLDNALRGKLGYVFHPAIRRTLKKLRNPYYSGDTGGEYPIIPVTDKIIADILGYPFEMTTQIPVTLTVGESSNCTEIYFGNWAELLIGQWTGFEVMASREAGTAFTTDQTWVRILAEVDFAIRHVESFCLCNTAKKE
jgi:HK97 family phage major capsid protein